MLKKTLSLLLLAVVCMNTAEARTSLDVKRETERAVSLMEHGKFGDARQTLTTLRSQISVDDVPLLRHIDYALARCAAELRDNEADEIMHAFLRRYPESVHINEIHFLLAMYYCEREEYSQAATYLDLVSYKTLNEEEREKYNMRKGYIEFVAGNHDKAYHLFSMLSPVGIYADHAVYYKSYIHYSRKEYDKAYKGFESLKNSESYAKVIPYYLFQIEFARGNYNYVVNNGKSLLNQSVELEKVELMRIMAEAYFRLGNYKDAYLYISMYKRAGGEMGRKENYLLGFAAYNSTAYDIAIETLLKVADGSDELAQNASYHLAYCYVHRNNKRQAIHAFAMAADEKFDNEISENALFNYGKLLFETGGGTFNETINVLTRYVIKYPESERVNDAKELLIAAYYNSHNYDMARNAILAFPDPDAAMRAALQKIDYFNGLEAYLANDYDKAKAALEESHSIGVTPRYSALSLFWLGEIAYKTGDFAKAANYYDTYLKRAPKHENEYKMALYNLGYAHFELEDFTKSKKAFEGFVWLHKDADRYRADAYNRLGDIHYSQRRYKDAIENYEKSIAIGTIEQNYAKYQRALSFGLAGQMSAKISALHNMKSEECGDYNDDAAYELGRTYVSLGRYADSASALEDFVKKHPQSPYITPALLSLGLVHLNLGNSDESLKYYDEIIKAAPQSVAAKDAIQSVREIYVARGQINEYFEYAEKTGVVCDTSVMARDSLSFRSAQNIYLANRVPEAVTRFKTYLKEYPKGYYINDALFCLSDCHLRNNSIDEAIVCLHELAHKPKNQYTISALDKLASLTFENAMYDKSYKAYRKLYDFLDNAVDRANAAKGYAESVLLCGADDVLLTEASELEKMADADAAVKRKVRFAVAKVYQSRKNAAKAMKIFEELAKDLTNVEGAESAYLIIEALYIKGKYDESEKKIYELSESRTPHSYWLGKAFILLGDIYVKRNDLFQARATYRSVVDGYSPADDGIVAEAQAKLDKLN